MPIQAEQLSELLDRHWGPLVMWIGTRDGISEDVVQQAFVALSAESDTPANPVAWLYTTARNIGINERKKLERRRLRQQAIAKPETQPCQLWRSQQSTDLAEQLQTLSDECRETVVAHVWGELTFAEIAEMTNRSQATVWREYQRALEQLRENVVPHER